MADGLDFESVVARFYESLYQFAFSLTHKEADACDLTQQTFYIWATKGHQLRDPAKVKTWLFTTLHRQFLESRRRLVRFFYLEDCSYKDIAEILNVPMGTVKSRISRGIGQLQALLADTVSKAKPDSGRTT